MVVLALDLSTKTGYAVLDGKQGQKPKLSAYGTVYLPKGVIKNYGDYPWSFVDAVDDLVDQLTTIWENRELDAIVIEETNLASFSRMSQKALEFIHHAVLLELRKLDIPVYYINTSEWRSILKLNLSTEEKKHNRMTKAQRAELGIKGKITKKHLSVRKANELYGLKLKIKSNDIADAICLGVSWFLGATVNN